MRRTLIAGVTLLMGVGGARETEAQSPQPPVLTLETANRVAAAAEAEARRNNWNVVIAVLDDGGYLVHLRRMDGVQLGSVAVAQEKAKTAVLFRRPTKVFADGVAGGNTALLRLPGVIPIEGGIPLLVADQLVGAIGVSGVTSAQDGQIAQAGVKALTPSTR